MRMFLSVVIAVFCHISWSGACDLTFMTHVIKPLSWQDQQQEFHGLAYDLSASTMARMGCDRARVGLYPFARALRLVEEQDDMVLFPVARTPDRESAVKWVGPLILNGVYFYQRSDNAVVIHTLDQLKQLHSIGVGNGNASMTLLSQQGFKNLYPVNDEIQALRMLALKRVDAIAVGEVVIHQAEHGGDFGAAAFRKIDIKLYDSSLYIAFSKNVSDADIAKWQKQLDIVKKARYPSLYRQYIQ